MIFPNLRASPYVAIFCAVLLVPSVHLFAQAPPGPLPPSQPLPPPKLAPPPRKQPEVEARKTLAGLWKLNTEQSDDPRRKLEDAQQTNAGSGGGPGGGGGRVGIGFPYPGSGGNGPFGGGRGRGMGGEDTDATERIQDLVRPDSSQTIALNEGELDSTNDQGNKVVYYTDGRKIQKSKDDSLKQIPAHWNGTQLVTDERGPGGRKMGRTLELSSDGRQFYETWHIENGRSGSIVVIRYVYDAAIQ